MKWKYYGYPQQIFPRKQRHYWHDRSRTTWYGADIIFKWDDKMKSFARLTALSTLYCLSTWASAVSLEFHACTIDIPENFSYRSKNNYFYSNDVFKNISIDDNEDVNTFYPNASEIKHMDSFRSHKEYYLFNYSLYDLNNPNSSISHIRLWKNNNSLNFVGFKLSEVKDMVKHCSDGWIHVSKEDFLEKIPQKNR